MDIIQIQTDLPPAHVAIWRFILAGPLMWLVMGWRKPANGWIPKKILGFLGLGLVYSVVSFSAVFALRLLTPTVYIIIIYLYPSLVVLYSLFTGKPVPRLWWLGLPLTLLGLVLTTYRFGQELTGDPIGILITLLNSLGMAAYMILSEQVFKGSSQKRLGTSWMITSTMVSGIMTIPLLGISLPQSKMGWILLIVISSLGTVMPILAMNTGLQLIGAARGSIIITLHPVLVVLFSTLFLNEQLTLQQWVGGVMVVGAVIMLQRSSDREGKGNGGKPHLDE